MNPPRKVKIGHMTYKIRLVVNPGKQGDAIGYTDNTHSTIDLQKDLDPYTIASTLHHEIGHAFWYLFGATTPEDEEKMEEHAINVLSAGYIMVEQDNPGLEEYFDYWLRKKKPRP